MQSAVPRCTASKASNAGTNSPAPNTLIVRRPPVASPMFLAKRSAAVPPPGNIFGQLVTMRHSCRPCEIAGAATVVTAAVAATPPTAAFVNLRRFIVVIVRVSQL